MASYSSSPKIRLSSLYVPIYIFIDRNTSNIEHLEKTVTCMKLDNSLLIYYSFIPFSVRGKEAELVNPIFLTDILLLSERKPQIIYDNNKIFTEEVTSLAE
ncbi:MAG: hypothetical protein JZD40_04900, partial [Sulfolobus sp.]|nr:hypothetical protein [Sulfolobus sp.]